MRDDFTDEVKRTLANRVNSVCSNPDCRAATAGPQDDTTKAVNVGVAAHITSAAPGGPRYDESLSPEERSHADNGIWLCQTCAKHVDNDVTQFPVAVLKAWKTLAEHEARLNVGKTIPPRFESESQRKAREIVPWIGKPITHTRINSGRAALTIGRIASKSQVILFDCNDLYVTIGIPGQNGYRNTIPLKTVEIAHDCQRDCLELQEPNN